MKQIESSRRDFLRNTGIAVAGAATLAVPGAHAAPKRSYNISLAGWSLHRTIGQGEGKVAPLDMPKLVRDEFDIGAIELVNNMMGGDDKPVLDQLLKNASDNNIKFLLIMIDGQGQVGAETPEERENAVKNHSHWIDVAEYLGCHSIRMNWGGAPRDIMRQGEEALDAFVARSKPGFLALCEYGDSKNINVIIENHGGPSSYPAAMDKLMAAVNHPRFGTLPDFGNFPEDVDNYEGIDALMKYAKAVSAKCYDFDDETGLETKLDFPRLIEIVCDKHAYNGFIGIEYEGDRLSEFDGVKAAKKLLEKLRG